MASIIERGIDWIESFKSEPAPGITPINLPIISSEEVLRDIEAGTRANTAGESVNHENSLEVSTVMACARVISEGLAQVSCKVMKEDKRGSLIEARDHPLYKLLNRKPNDWQTSFEFREQAGLHLACRNNAYIFKNRGLNNEVAELYAFPPDSVTVTQNARMELTYEVARPGQAAIKIPASDIWHIRGPSWNGFQGHSAIEKAKRAIGLSLAMESYGSNMFINGAQPSGVLTTRAGGQQLTIEQRVALKQMWAANHQGTKNAHKTALLPFDLEYKQTGGSAQDAQWLESRRFLIEEICRFFRVRPIMVMQQGATSYASVEQELLAHLTHTLMPWYERFEQSAEVNLLTDEELDQGYCVKLNAKALLRGSTAERTAYYNAMVTLGVMSVNDVRAREDLPLSDDPEADKLRSAANLFGNKPAADPPSTDESNNNEVNK